MKTKGRYFTAETLLRNVQKVKQPTPPPATGIVAMRKP